VARLRELGHAVLWRDMSSPHAVLRQGRLPLSIVRVIVPGLVPVSFGYGTEPLGMPRLECFGGRARPRYRKPLFPHPFA